MKQADLADRRTEKRSKERLLEESGTIIPWQRRLSAIAPFYPQAPHGHGHVLLETSLRIHLLQRAGPSM